MPKLVLDTADLVAALIEALRSAEIRALLVELLRETSPANTNGRALSVPDAAAQLGISKSKMWALVRAKKVKVIRIGRSTRIPAQALDGLFQGVESSGPPPTAEYLRDAKQAGLVLARKAPRH
jgi:excisionase family DNA binding protein